MILIRNLSDISYSPTHSHQNRNHDENMKLINQKAKEHLWTLRNPSKLARKNCGWKRKEVSGCERDSQTTGASLKVVLFVQRQ